MLNDVYLVFVVLCICLVGIVYRILIVDVYIGLWVGFYCGFEFFLVCIVLLVVVNVVQEKVDFCVCFDIEIMLQMWLVIVFIWYLVDNGEFRVQVLIFFIIVFGSILEFVFVG